MKIAMVTQSMLVGYGVGEVADMLSKEMVKHGHKVTLLTGDIELPATEYESVELKPLPLPLGGEYWQTNFLTDMRLAPLTLKSIKESDIVVTFDPMHVVGMLAKLVLKLPVVMYYFGIVPAHVLGAPTRRAEAARQRLVWHQSFRFADVIMTNSRYTLTLLPRGLRRKAVVNYHGVDHLISSLAEDQKRRFKKKLGVSGKKTILSIGRFSTPYKGMKSMVEIFESLRKKRKDVALILLGRNAQGGMFEREPDIHVFTDVSREFLMQCLGSCDVYSSASMWEGFNIPLAAAQANGKPAVAFNVGAHSEVLLDGRTGFLVDTAEEFKDSLELLVNIDEIRSKMGEAAARHAEAFRWESCGKALERIIANLAIAD